MGMPFPMITAYERMVRDAPRHELPPGACWTLQDAIPDRFDAPVAQRGAMALWSHVTPATADPIGIGWGQFSGGTGNLLLMSDGSAQGLDNSKVQTARGTFPVASPTSFRTPPMVSHRQKLVFAPRGKSGGNGLYIYDGASNIVAVTGMSGLGPLSVGLFNDYTAWFGDESNSHPQRIGFSNAGDPSTYQPTVSFVDMPQTVLGGACLRDLIVVFCKNAIYRVRGSIPPGNGPSDMRVELLSPKVFGLIDPRSIVYYGTSVIFANQQGVWMTDGVSLKNLTEKGGIHQLWINAVNTGITECVSWVYRGNLFVSIWNGVGHYSNPPTWTLMYDFDRNAWSTMSNMNFFGGAAQGIYGSTEDVGLFFNQNDAPSGFPGIATIASIFTPDNGADPFPSSNTLVEGLMVETGLLRGFMRLHRKWIPSSGLQTWRNIYLNYELQGTSTLQVWYKTDDFGNYKPLTSLAANAASTKVRSKIPLGETSNMLGLKYNLSGGSTTGFRLYETEAEFYPRETSRLA